MNEVDFFDESRCRAKAKILALSSSIQRWVDIPLENIASLSVASGGRVYMKIRSGAKPPTRGRDPVKMGRGFPGLAVSMQKKRWR